MRPSILLGVPLLLLVGPARAQETAPDARANELRDRLVAAERQFLEAWTAGDRAGLDKVLAPDYTHLAGRQRLTRAEALERFPAARPRAYELTDAEALAAGDGAAVLTYRLRLTTPAPGPVETREFTVSSLWLTRGGKSLSLFRHVAALTEAPPTQPAVLRDIDVALQENAVAFTYRGTEPLVDVNALVNFTFGDSQLPYVRQYWATWRPGETKALGLGFLARPTSTIERVDLMAMAMRGREAVRAEATGRRQATAP